MAAARWLRGIAVAATLLATPLAGAANAGEAGAAEEDLADRFGIEHAGDRPVPAAAADTAPPALPILEREVTRPGLRGFLAEPEGRPDAPGLLVIHEWWGLNDNIRAMTRRLAGLGYRALAIDLYDGQVATTPDEARRLVQSVSAHPDAARAQLAAGHAWLVAQGAPRTASIGWCFGGGWSLEAALGLGDELDAAVVYYGRVETDPARLESLRAPVLGIFAGRDRAIPLEGVRRFEATLEELGKPIELHVYPDADHAFANPSGTRYDEAAARDAWQKTQAFLALHLRP